MKRDPQNCLVTLKLQQRRLSWWKILRQIAPEDINDMTRRSVSALAGTGLIGVARDNLEKCYSPSARRWIYQIELDLETGKYEILDYLGIADCGTVLHPEA